MTVNQVLAELGASDLPLLLVFNKADQLESTDALEFLELSYPDAITISALDPDDVERLRQAISVRVDRHRVDVELLIPYENGHAVSVAYESGEVLRRGRTGGRSPHGPHDAVRCRRLGKTLDAFVCR